MVKRMKTPFPPVYKAFLAWHTRLWAAINRLTPRRLRPLLELRMRMDENYTSLVAAGMAFYFFLATFPALAALVSLYGLFSDPAYIEEHLKLLARFLPSDALSIIADQARQLVQSSEDALNLGLIVSLALTLYSAAKGIGALIKGLNIIYKRRETRGFFVLNFTAVTLTFLMLIYFLLALTVIAGIPAIFNFIHLPEKFADMMLWIRWPLLFGTGFAGFEVLYAYAPSPRRSEKISTVTGSLFATALWMGASAIFSAFVINFGSFNETYGSLSAIVILLLWLWLSAMTILMGAELNAILAKKPP